MRTIISRLHRLFWLSVLAALPACSSLTAESPAFEAVDMTNQVFAQDTANPNHLLNHPELINWKGSSPSF